MLRSCQNGQRFELSSPTLMPRASGFLWNRKMMIQANCRGFAVAQYMQPEPAKYTYAPNLEAKTFMQPEQPYFAHHPGRFVYIKDEQTGKLFSAPYEPVRCKTDSYCFSVGKSDIAWTVEHLELKIELKLSLPAEDVAELWQLKVTNLSANARKISIYPYVPFGYMSWMNQSARYNSELGAVVANCVTPYQKVADYFKNKDFKDKTYLLFDREPNAYELAREAFEGEGGLHAPSAIELENLANGDAIYETPVAALQYKLSMEAGAEENFRFILGPAFNEAEIDGIKSKYFNDEGFITSQEAYKSYIAQGDGIVHIETPDKQLDNFVNHWLPRQVYYHGDVNRLSTDPQTRNYIQDNMGMSYIAPEVTRNAFIHALSQQEANGAIPDGILLTKDAELKYINQIPHTDHCIWFPVCLQAYLDESNDYSLLDEPVPDWEGEKVATVKERISRAMDWLIDERDERGLCYIAQGDWCDPMNMVGYKGKGVSGWLSLAAAYALNLWADTLDTIEQHQDAQRFRKYADDINIAVNEYLWDGQWFARGITDDNVVFGTQKDPEGRIFLNPQSWAILSGAAIDEQQQKMVNAINEQLNTPYGVMMLAPAFTAMRDDIGRVTQKHPGSAENGSIYNHAAIFYAFSLYQSNRSDLAFDVIRKMIPGPDLDDYQQRGQMPVYIPNYYRGAYYQHPRTAGRSSQLFNTGTVSWVYRCIIEGLLGLKGCRKGLLVQPQMPSSWDSLKATREFRGATFTVTYERSTKVKEVTTFIGGERIKGNIITDIQVNKHYDVHVEVPANA